MAIKHRMDLHSMWVRDLVENYIVDATDNAATNLKWTSTTVQSYTVPTGKRWLLFGGHVKRDTQTGTATLLVDVYNESDKLILRLDTQANAIATTGYPNATSAAAFVFPMPMEAGWYVKITVGEAQGAAAAASCIVLEFDV